MKRTTPRAPIIRITIGHEGDHLVMVTPRDRNRLDQLPQTYPNHAEAVAAADRLARRTGLAIADTTA